MGKTKKEQDKTKLDKEKQNKEVEELKKQLEEYTDHLKRLQAEFENYMKRVEKEREEFINYASEKILKKILSVVDDIDQAEKQIKTLPEETKKGIELIFKKIYKILEEENVKPIQSKNQKFDPFTQEALLQEETTEYPENFVIEELQKGYTRNGKVIRYAKVKISKKPMEGEKNDKGKNSGD
ncbi:nucleotide exchange factor GrpE [Candidatus Woesearchaeota archaeon]|nr:MAG: nucleotide exchange factor GrpE [Candidatus Woesearchaeota archaeon ex4484_78]RLE45799.1 MAG: nucleotide exchange factor GrpE [Candidatus Woesearchaeota archaeon]